ncbi:MAG: sigma-54 dependent transcriptional regulator [Candidatus Omnitrophica bacterium]|nr:sigma-54 dependent transcriptional regulator [Candidatus Omnitrophota bacterium]MCM8802420.1 sigma-54 dependent transcriptional regulator [Candidatus Omnitrophota bacterium]
MNRILIIDDEEGVRESLKFALKDKYKIILSSNGKEGMFFIEKENPDLIILDILLPDIDGISLLKEIKKNYKDIPVIMLTAVSQIKTAVEAMKIGAVDYITKPFDIEELILIIEKTLKTKNLFTQIELLKEEIQTEYPLDTLVYKSETMKKVIEIAEKSILTDAPVLITGPTGVGKELIARYIHEKSSRKNQPFVVVHCAAIPETLFESEIFGYEKGAFTNAYKSKKGKIEIADDGTLFFDEIGEISQNIQVKLLRFLEEKKFSPLGSNELVESNARIISATSKDLKEEIEKGKFRDDLFYRLCVIPIRIPPLKERKEDIIPLVNYYINFYKKRIYSKIKDFSEEVKIAFLNYDWPGNVRELKNIIERIFVLNSEKVIINIEDLPEELKKKTKVF